MNTTPQLFIGTGGWQYFIIPGRDPLREYSRIFNFVEVNVTFYREVSIDEVANWRRRVPDNFIFSVRAPKIVTHDYMLKPVKPVINAMDYISEVADILNSNVIVLETPSKLAISKKLLKEFVESIDLNDKYLAVEPRGAISKEARKHRDRVSLIVSKGFSSAIAQFPTTNFNLLLGKIRKIGLDDFTPLASGMYRAVNLAIKEKRRGYEPVIVIISDGNVNVPLGRRLYNKWFSSDPSVQSTLEVGYLIKKKGIETIVINTKHREIIYEQNTTIVSGTELLLNLAKITEGAYIGIRG